VNFNDREMKKLFCIAAFSVLSFGAFAQENKCEKIVPQTYCIVSNHGRHYITHDGVREDKDVKLENGNIIHSEGVIETKDRFIVMHPNQCYRMDPIIVLYTELPIVDNK
jgi:hypothetical protein